jgi:hypothetical protein
VILERVEKPTGIVIDLAGAEGNAFYILSLAKRLSRTLEKEWHLIQDEMTSGDYDNLVNVFDKHFGDIVTMYK